jgi:hypothetical protein
LYKLLALFLLASWPAGAQNVVTSTLTAKQDCGSPEVMFQESMEYEESPLFGGSTLIIGVDDKPYWGTMLFTVNQDNGFWTLFTFYSEDFVCITASGINFVASQ